MRIINIGTTKFNVALGRGLRAFKPWNWVRVLVAVPLLLTAALWVMAPQLGQAQGTAPAQPTGLAATAGYQEAALTWDDPEDSSITGYEYLFHAQVAKLVASDGADNDYFGFSVAVDGDTAVVGAPHFWAIDPGAAYVYTRQSGAWNQVAKLTASDGADNDQFGGSVAIDGDTVVVGADGDDSDQGAAHVFTKPAGGWATTSTAAKLTASDGAADDQFGISVAMDGDTVVVSADEDDSDQGAAYVFIKPSNGWATTSTAAKLTASDGAADDHFGVSVAVDGDTVVVGAPLDDDKGQDSGAAYVHQVSDWTDVPDSAAGETNATSYTVTGLTNDVEHNFWIRATNSVGASPASDIVTVTPVNTAPTAVDDAATTPRNTAVDINVVVNDTDPDPSATLSVTAVATPSNGTAVIKSGSSTTVTYTPGADFTGTDSFDYTLSDGTDTDTGTVTVITLWAAAPTNLVAGEDSTRVVLEWDTGDPGITHYLISSEITDGSGDPPPDKLVSAGSRTKMKAGVTSLTNGTEYTFTVQAAAVSGGQTVVAGLGASVNATPAVNVPAAPTNLIATPGDGRVRVTWDNPRNITIRKYQYSTDGGTTFNHMNRSGRSTTSFTFENLDNGEPYTLAIRASNLSGESAPATVTAIPGWPAPTNLVAAPDSGRIVLQWDTGDPGIAHYLVSYRAIGFASPWTPSPQLVVAAGSETKTQAEITSLNNSFIYIFRVQAAEVSGSEAEVAGASSSVVAWPTVAVPAAPTNLTATPGDGRVSVTWDHPDNITIRKYQYSTDGGTTFNHMNRSNQNTTSFTFKNLTNGTEYQLAIRASNLSGESAPATVTATPSD